MSAADNVLVSVGLPVYNGAAGLRRALDALLAQTHRNLEIIVSDNCSTDATPDICRDCMSRDSRVRYSRNDQNIGGCPNFEKVLRQATARYFMWAAYDDWWAPTFVAENLRVLREQPDCVASMSRVTFMDGERVVWMPFIERADWRGLSGSVQANVCHYVANSGMNSRFYAVFRREALLNCLPFESYTGSDNALIVRTLAFGKYGEVNRPLFFRGMAGESARHLSMLSADRSPIGRVLPLWQYTKRVWHMPHVRHDIGLLISLITVNTVFFVFLLLTLAKAGAARLFDRRVSGQSSKETRK